MFRYDLQVRVVRYYNRLPSLWRGEHGIRSSRRLQSHNLTLLPGSRLEVLLGWDGNLRTGPGFASAAAAPADGVFEDRAFLRFRQGIRQSSSVYRIGATVRIAGLALTLVRAVELYRETGEYSNASRLATSAPNVQPVDSLQRSQPFHGRTPMTSVALRSRGNGRLGIDARYVHTGGYRNSRLLERVSATARTGSAASHRELFIVGDASRRHGSGDVSLTFAASGQLTVTNVTSFHNTSIDGKADVVETIFFQDQYLRLDHLGVRRLSNATEALFRPVRQVAVTGAFRATARRARARDSVRYPEFEFGRPLQGQDNRLRSAAAGVRWLPATGIRASADLEIGRADRPLAATSRRRFANHSARLRWTRGALSAGGFFVGRVNDNPADLLAYSSRTRVQGLQASWALPGTGTALDASYTRLGMDVTAGVLNLFEIPAARQRWRSDYSARIDVFSVGMKLALAKRATLAARHSSTQDTVGAAQGLPREDGGIASGLPVSYHAPQIRISVQIARNVTWNAGWQRYSYSERFRGTRGYRAHVCFASLTVGL